jgi:hypothetical protein
LESQRELASGQLRFVLGVIPEGPEVTAQEHVLAGQGVWELSAAAVNHQQELAVQSGPAGSVRILVSGE